MRVVTRLILAALCLAAPALAFAQNSGGLPADVLRIVTPITVGDCLQVSKNTVPYAASDAGAPCGTGGGGGGTVTSFSFLNGNGFNGTVLNASTTPSLSLAPSFTGFAYSNGTGFSAASTTGSGNLVLANSPTLVTPNLGTPSAVVLTNGTGLPVSTGLTGLGTGVGTALGVNTGSAGAFVVNGGALGTPSSGVGTNITGVNAASVGGYTLPCTVPTLVSGDYLTNNGTTCSWAAVSGSGTMTDGSGTTAIGAIPYSSTTAHAYSLLAGNTTTTPAVLMQTGTGTASAAPTWTATSALTGLTADTAPASADLLLIHSNAANSDESITVATFLSGLAIPTASSTTTTAGECFLSTTTAGVYAPGACPSGGGVTVESGGTSLGTATTINFSTNLTATLSSGVATVTATGGSATGIPISFGCGNLAAGGTGYNAPGICAASGAYIGVTSVAGTITNFYVNIANSPSSGQSDSFTLYINGAATAVTCTIAAGSTSCSDTTDSATIGQGKYFAIDYSIGASSGAGETAFGLELTP